MKKVDFLVQGYLICKVVGTLPPSGYVISWVATLQLIMRETPESRWDSWFPPVSDERTMPVKIMKYWSLALIAFHKSIINGLIITHQSPDRLATKSKVCSWYLQYRFCVLFTFWNHAFQKEWSEEKWVQMMPGLTLEIQDVRVGSKLKANPVARQ